MKNIVAYYRLSKKSRNGLNYGIETQKKIVLELTCALLQSHLYGIETQFFE